MPKLGRHFLIFLLTLPLLLTGCQAEDAAQGQAPAAEPEVAVLVAHPVERPLVQTYPGRLAAFRRAEVRARSAGILMERNYEEGRDVAAGELLFSIDDAQRQIDLLTAESSLARAEAEHQGALDTLRRHQSLVGKGSINEHDYIASVTAEKKARAEVASASAALAQAKLELSYTRVTAPIAGRAGLALVSEGALVGQDELTKMTVVEQLDPIYVDFSQPAADLAAVAAGVRHGRLQKMADEEVEIFLILSDGSRYEHPGRLIFTGSAVDADTDNVPVRAVFPNPDKVLLPGGYLKVSVARAVNPAVYLTPRDSLVRQGDESWLMLLSAESLVEKRAVTAVEMDGRNWVVTAGLADGDRIIVNGSQSLALEGQKAVMASATDSSPAATRTASDPAKSSDPAESGSAKTENIKSDPASSNSDNSEVLAARKD